MSADGVFNSPDELSGLTLYGNEGEKIGNVGQVYVDDRTGRPEWVTAKTGLFGMKESLVPLSGGRLMGEDLHVPYDKDTIKDAPRLDADEHLDPAQERQLYEHYGLTGTGMGTGTGTDMGTDAKPGADTGTAAGTGAATGAAAGTMAGAGMSGDTRTGAAPGALAGSGAAAGRDTAGAHGAKGEFGDELIRSEEELRVGTEERVIGKATLRKVVVTENVTTSVPVSHEEVRVVHEPITASDGVGRMDIGEAETEVTLHAEQPVVRKETVAVERVRLETEKVTEQQEVSSDVRKERIEYDPGRDDKGMDDMGDMGGRRGPSH